MTPRAERLQLRFKLIQRTLQELHGREIAFGSASAAWLMALQYVHKQAMVSLQRRFGDDSSVYGTWDAAIAELEAEMEALLQSFHKELCEHLRIDAVEAVRLAKAFREVIRDICQQGG